VAQAVHLLADIDPEGLGHPFRLGDDEHRFVQVQAVAVFQGDELLRSQMQTIGQFGHADPSPLPGPAQALAQIHELGDPRRSGGHSAAVGGVRGRIRHRPRAQSCAVSMAMLGSFVELAHPFCVFSGRIFVVCR